MNFRKNGGDIKIILQTAREIELKLFQEYSIKLEANHIFTQFLSKETQICKNANRSQCESSLPIPGTGAVRHDEVQ